MQLQNADADIFIPEELPLDEALARTTHLCIAAHQDDIEIMAYSGIAECFASDEKWFTGVVVTHGGGSPRSGGYADYTDERMRQVRRREQRKAAFAGNYSCQLQLGYSSAEVKNTRCAAVIDDIRSILMAARPDVVYIHNLADKHPTHVALALRCLEAIRSVSTALRPVKVYGCEVWRDLDWLPDELKTALPTSSRPNIAAALIGVFDSQVSGGKRYDLATAGRRLANATYFASHQTDIESEFTFAMDLTELALNPALSIRGFVLDLIDRFREDVARRLAEGGVGQPSGSGGF
jgi:LmbE family N-acetylglucosaminyl deacetylase